jgi:hypothetical protein
MQQFELHAYKGDEFGVLAERAEVTYERGSESAVRAKAGRMAKRFNGPVDLALAGNAEWNERYMTTASPSEFHSAGYRFERLS